MVLFNKKAAMFGLEGESLKKQSGELFLARLQRLTFRLVEGHRATRPLNSKAAMFGLEGESLKKQSGELFLARLQRLTFRLVEGHQATRPLNSKAAMFGLDARIALAIFAALSVITGAALYNIMQEIKLTSLISEFEEIAQATEAYALDTGFDLPRHTIAEWACNPGELLTSTKPGWKGPYVRRELDTFDHRFKNSNDFGRFYIYKTLRFTTPCNNTDECYVWIKLDHLTHNVCDRLDLRIDGAVDDTKGKVMIQRVDATDCIIFYKAYPALTHTYSY